jgi:hypothetical protein
VGESIHTINKNTEPSMDASKKVGLEINAEKTKYMLFSCHQNAGQNHDIKRAHRFFKNVEWSKYLGMTVTNQNLIQEEISMLNSGNACGHLVQSLLCFHLLSKTIQIRIQKIKFLCDLVKLGL